MYTSESFILTEHQKTILEFYFYENKDYDLVFEYLKKIGVESKSYNEVFKQL